MSDERDIGCWEPTPRICNRPARAKFQWDNFIGWMMIFGGVGAIGFCVGRAVCAPPIEPPTIQLAARVMIESGLAKSVKLARQSVTAPGEALTLDGGATVVNPTREPMRVMIDGDDVTLAPYGMVLLGGSSELCSVDCGTDCAECWVYYAYSATLKQSRWYCGTSCTPAVPGLPCAHDCMVVFDPDGAGPPK